MVQKVSTGLCTSAMINIQRKVLRKPILRVSEHVPYVAIDVPLSVNPTETISEKGKIVHAVSYV